MLSPQAIAATLDKALRISLISAGALIAYQVFNWLVNRYASLRLKRRAEATGKALAIRRRVETSSALLRQTAKYSILIAAAYLILGELIEWRRFMAIVTGVGIVGVIIAFSAQALVRDLISGLFILVEGQYGVGDIVRLKAAGYDVFGIVEELGLRTTIVRDLAGNERFVPNGNIIGVDRYPQGFLRFAIDMLLPAGTAPEPVEAAISRAAVAFGANPYLLRPPKLSALSDHGEAGVLVTILAQVVPSQDWVAERVAEACAEELRAGLSLPEPPAYSSYAVNERTLKRYKRSIVLQ